MTAQPLRMAIQRLSGEPLLVAGLVILLLLALLAIVGPLVVDPASALVAAAPPRRPPSPEHMLGTDAQGRDMLAALILATPQTLKIGLLAGSDRALPVGALLGLSRASSAAWRHADPDWLPT